MAGPSDALARKIKEARSIEAPGSGRVIGLFDSPLALSALLDELPLGVVIIDEGHKVVTMNRSFEVLTGFNREESFGVPCNFILRTNLCQKSCPVFQARQTGGSIRMEGDIINRERRRVAVAVTVTPLKNPAGDLIGFLEAVEDLSHLKKPQNRLRQDFGFGGIMGRSLKMEEVFRILPVVAQTDSSVLITGETGTGKDLAAEAIHEASERNRGPFVKVNCGALPETLLESELFGHQKGAFTGAVSDKPGRIRLAGGGTLFLTEVGDLPLSLQVKLLTFLDDKVVYPLGSSKGYQADVRIVAATHRHLEAEVKEGRFREDLLYRLNVVRVHLPPVRERGDDATLLLDHFLKHFCARFDKKIKGFSASAHALLRSYSYPGNVREIRNIVEYAANICQNDEIDMVHLPAYLTETPVRAEVRALARDLAPGTQIAGLADLPADSVNWSSIERRLIIDALVKAKGKRSKAAELLGWGRSTLWRKMKLYGIEG